MRPGKLSRRGLLKMSLAGMALLLLDALRKFLSYEAPPDRMTRMTLSGPEEYLPGSVTLISEAQCWILRDDAGLYAISAVCSHLGCQIKEDDGRFTCPCHGSQFSYHGAVLAGPAVVSLRHLELTKGADNRLIVDTRVTVSASERLDPYAS